MINEFFHQAQQQEVAYFGGNIIRTEGGIPGYNIFFSNNIRLAEVKISFR